MRNALIIYLVLCWGFVSNSKAQTITHVKDSSRLTIKVIDVVDMTNLTGYSLTISNIYDTLSVKVDNIQNLYFDLDSCVSHTVTVSKKGYKTISATCKFPNNSAYVEIELFMPKENLTKDEKKQAHLNTSKLKEWNQDKRGGFEKVTPNKNEFFTARIRILSSGSEETSYESSE